MYPKISKIKTTWDIIKKEAGRNTSMSAINTLVMDGKKFNNQQDIAEEFNKHFANVAEKIKNIRINNNYITVNDSKNVANYTEFMGQAFTDKCQPINYYCSTREEIENIITSLKFKNSYGYDII